MPDKFTGAHLCEFTFQCVTQPGVDPSELGREIQYAMEKICGRNAGVTTIGHDPEFAPAPFTYRPMFVREDRPWKDGERKS
jgi:hypothetical protein